MVGQRNRPRDETTVILTSTRLQEMHRNRCDIYRNILNHLANIGPSGITEILYVAEINHLKAKQYLDEMASTGLIVRKPISDFLKVGRPSLEQIRKNRIARRNEYNLKTVIMITQFGRQYLKKANQLELLLRWPE